MAEDVKSFGELKSTLIKAKAPDDRQRQPKPAKSKRDSKGRAYATGRRKNAVARVWIKPGRGQITVNGRDEKIYFARPVLRMILRQPLIAANRDGQFDVVVTVTGGGLSGQAGAVRHGISRALVAYEPSLRRGAQAGRLPDPRSARGRTQEVWPAQGSPQLPVLEALVTPFEQQKTPAVPQPGLFFARFGTLQAFGSGPNWFEPVVPGCTYQ